ncbi:unnamed protein product [Effrenium voratum]|nr:unnamed protein product [Effrenium voratum]
MSALRQGILSELRRGKSVRQILRGLGERKQGDQILAALEILAQGGVRLEGRDLTAGITTCGKLAQWRQALLLATSARSFQVQPSGPERRPGRRARRRYGCGSKNRYQHGTLGGNMDQDLRNAPPV